MGCTSMQITQNWPQKIRKSIVQVKKSSFHVISTNVPRMDWKLSSTLKKAIFSLLKDPIIEVRPPSKTAQVANESKMTSKISKMDFFGQKSNFHFISNQSRTDFSIIKFSRIINKNKYMIDGKTVVSWLTHPEIQTKASYNCVLGISACFYKTETPKRSLCNLFTSFNPFQEHLLR